ncbi:MAG: hypothetical protein M3401_16595 [Actinomycetota bacterium]|nr:hypothetical protein [Actinomycetota bacterium]
MTDKADADVATVKADADVATDKVDAATVLVSWRESSEYVAARARMLRWMVVTLVLWVAAYLLVLVGEDLIPDPATRYLVAGFPGTVGLFCYVQALTTLSAARARFQQQQEHRASQGVRAALDDLEESTALPALLRLNRKQIEEYHVLTKGQASSAYVASQIAMSAGLLVLLIGSAVAVALNDPASKATAAGLTAIGSLLAGYIGRTFIRTYERTLVQLNHFFEQPLLNSYLLTAERLVGAVSQENRDEMYSRLIERSLDALADHASRTKAERESAAPTAR